MAKDLNELSLFDILPDSIAGFKEVRDTARAIDPEMLSVTQSIRETLILSRIGELPEAVLDLLAWQFHIDNYEPLALPIEQKRAQVRDAILIHRKKGTPWALKQELSNIGYPVKLIEDTGSPYIFDLQVLLNGQADTTAVYNAAVSAAKRAKNARSKIGIVDLRAESECVIHVGGAAVSGAYVEVFPWSEKRSETSGVIHAAAAVTRLSVYAAVAPEPGAQPPALK